MKSLRVWWSSRVPINDSLELYYVNNLKEAKEKLEKLAKRDLENEEVTDNVGGLEVLEDGEWSEWNCDECGSEISDCECKIKAKPMSYHMKRYKEDPEFRKKMIASSVKYHHTEKGKEVVRKAKTKIINDGYYKKYFKAKREQARKDKICLVCFKNEMKVGVLCGSCYNRVQQRSKKK